MGQKYFNGETLKSWETLQLLKQRITVGRVPDTALIEVRVFSDNADEAAVLANAITTTYVNDVSTGSRVVTAQIIDNAHAIKAPVRPNVMFNLISGALIGVFLGSIVGIGVAGFVYIKSRNELIP